MNSSMFSQSSNAGLSCTTCGASLSAHDRFCQQCGQNVSSASRPASAAEPEAPALTELAALVERGEAPAPRRRRRRKERRPRYLKAFIAAPIALLLALMVVGGSAMYRIQGTVGTLNSLSALPETITDATLPDTASGVTVVDSTKVYDTRAAREALRAEEQSSGGGFLDNLRREAAGIRDVASGAAIATGLRQPAAEPVTVMVVGTTVQAGAAIDVGNRPGVIMVMHLNPDAGTCRGLVVPTNTLADLPGYGQSAINNALLVGGIPFQQLVLEDYLDIEIDHYALLESGGFRDLVESLGGITVDVEPEFASPAIPAGTHRISGDQALEHYRFAGKDDDAAGRFERQQHIIEGLINEARGANLLTGSLDLMTALENSVRTSFDVADAASFAEQHQAYCTADAFDLEAIPGEDRPGTDPILQDDLTFHVADAATVAQHVNTLLQGDGS